MKHKTYYQMTKNERVLDINIYGDITSSAPVIRNWYGDDGSVCANDIKKEIEGTDVDAINVYINSYGGEVAEALAIYSVLKRHSAEVHTYCDGFACSAATIIFCAGDTRTMGSIALLMIHNCMSYIGYANSEEMRKAAEDNDKINQSSIEAYKKVCNLSEKEIKKMMNKETWLTAQECLEYGFATEIADQEETEEPVQTAFGSIREAVLREPAVLESDGMEPILQKLDEILETVKKERNGDLNNLGSQGQTGKTNFLETFFKNII